MKKLNKATMRNINKFVNFTLVFVTYIKKKEFNFSLHQIELSQSMCELAKLDVKNESDNHELLYEFLDKLYTKTWMHYFYL